MTLFSQTDAINTRAIRDLLNSKSKVYNLKILQGTTPATKY